MEHFDQILSNSSSISEIEHFIGISLKYKTNPVPILKRMFPGIKISAMRQTASLSRKWTRKTQSPELVIWVRRRSRKYQPSVRVECHA